jgi:hypothetical protein
MSNFKRSSFSFGGLVKVGLIILINFGTSHAQGAGEISWLAFGDLRGQIGPCGCSEATNLGGLARLSYYLSEVRTHGPSPVYVFNLGNNYKLEPGDGERDELVDEALRVIAPSVSLMGQTEARFFKKASTKPFPGLILSNAGESQFKRFAKSDFHDNKIIALGYNHNLPGVLTFGAPLKTQWQKTLSKYPGHQKVLLFAGPRKVLQNIYSAKLFDVIVAANEGPLSEPASPTEKEQPGRLLVLKDVYQVPSYGQGVLKGGGLRKAPPKLDLCKPGDLACSSAKPFVQGDDLFTWLTPEYEKPSKVQPLIDAWLERERESFALLVESRKAMLPTSPFAGAAACQSCHQEAFKTWQNSKHAHALETLPGDHQKVSECVECHVLGLKEDGGFVSKEVTPNFAGVQCETCHGPRKEHTRNPMIKPALSVKPGQVCTSCHKLPHSDNFRFEVYWPKIKH